LPCRRLEFRTTRVIDLLDDLLVERLSSHSPVDRRTLKEHSVPTPNATPVGDQLLAAAFGEVNGFPGCDTELGPAGAREGGIQGS